MDWALLGRIFGCVIAGGLGFVIVMVFCFFWCQSYSPSEDSDRDIEIRNIRYRTSEIEEELLRNKFDETVIDMEETNYQFENINRVRQDCRGPVGPSGTRGLPQATPLPNFISCCLCLPSEESLMEEELIEKKSDETVIDMEEPNYQFEDINGVRQDCRGPVGPSGTRGPPQAIPLPNLSLN